MAWYEIINAKSDNFVADRDAEELVRHFAAVLHGVEPPGDAEIFYGRTTNSARRYYVSLSPEAAELAERVLASYDATESVTSGKAGGLKKVEPLKADRYCEPLKAVCL